MSTKAMEALKEAREAVVAWSDYVPEYFRQKHDLAGDLAKIDEALADLEAQGGQAGEVISRKPYQHWCTYCLGNNVADCPFNVDPIRAIPHPQPSPSEVLPWPPTPEMLDALRTGSRKDFPSDELCRVRYAALRAAIQAPQVKGAEKGPSDE